MATTVTRPDLELTLSFGSKYSNHAVVSGVLIQRGGRPTHLLAYILDTFGRPFQHNSTDPGSSRPSLKTGQESAKTRLLDTILHFRLSAYFASRAPSSSGKAVNSSLRILSGIFFSVGFFVEIQINYTLKIECSDCGCCCGCWLHFTAPVITSWKVAASVI